jgi:hypothetical protein
VQRRFVFVIGNSVCYAMRIALPALTVHLFKNTLAGQFNCTATLTEPDPCVFF